MWRRIVVTCGVFALATSAWTQVDNLALNGSFEEDEVILDDGAWESWATWGDADGIGSDVFFDEDEFIDGSRSLRVEPIGTVNWHFIVLNLPIPVNQGDDYTVSFWAKGEKTRPLSINFKATDNTVSWDQVDIIISDVWEEYHATGVTLSGEMKVEWFCSAGNEVILWLDFVNIYAGGFVEGVEPSAGPQAVNASDKLATAWATVKNVR
ncbi:hypothetical protein HN371_28270 [Candidatus Poribacteria bacterium]|jgi:hypothetical protein|nr:hypothetical protein [Candidatus Poribacteria bacterium]MBT5531672.1 hypothetical protein [Candidatus Poribacteria bacterium]MBT5709864.1 hypothetical protein [Candidatus Poribacteria bacterium]MBT7098489.1 hypothetical protein [Candidatus Poribacteria bacterium]MBT7806866.1 hypothetical protein [Candidatus Poribacteria bacterium]